MDDSSLLSRFEEGTLQADQWRHRDHLRVAYLLLCQCPFDAALARMRDGLKKLNAVHGVPDAIGRGYNETITQAWLRIVAFMICEHGPAENSEAFLERHPELAQPNLIRLFYSRQRMHSTEAKAKYLTPDLHPIVAAREAWPWQLPKQLSQLSQLSPQRISQIGTVVILIILLGPFLRFWGQGPGGFFFSTLLLTLIGLPIYIALSATLGRRSNAKWASGKARNIASGVYLALCVFIGIAARILRDSEFGAALALLGMVALLGMFVVVFVWLFTRKVPKPAGKSTLATNVVAAPHPLD